MNTGDKDGKANEADERAFNDALKRMLKTPPKSHAKAAKDKAEKTGHSASKANSRKKS